jgi:hypothetical protein
MVTMATPSPVPSPASPPALAYLRRRAAKVTIYNCRSRPEACPIAPFTATVRPSQRWPPSISAPEENSRSQRQPARPSRPTAPRIKPARRPRRAQPLQPSSHPHRQHSSPHHQDSPVPPPHRPPHSPRSRTSSASRKHLQKHRCNPRDSTCRPKLKPHPLTSPWHRAPYGARNRTRARKSQAAL